jgi:Calx-beta domain
MAATVSVRESKTILEGNSGIQTISFDVILSQVISSLVQIPYQIGIATDTATIDEDFTINIEPVTFNVGDPLIKTIIFEIKGDRIVEANEIFTITLGTPIGATLGSTTVATGTIFNDDSLPTVTIAPTTNASETGTIGSFTVTRTGLTELPLTVSINSNGGSATANNDHQPLPTQVTIAAGQTQAIINVTPIDDDLYEGSETIKANLVAASTYTLGTNSAEIALIDNETIATLPIISIIPINNSNLPLEQLPDKQSPSNAMATSTSH